MSEPTHPIDRAFAAGRKAFIPFLPAGYPSLAATAELLGRLNGIADLIEVGVPFSDPVADGPVIQAAYTLALNQGVRVDDVMNLGEPSAGPPRVLMASYSLIVRRGPGRFVERALAGGYAGAVVPDLPCDEADEFAALCADRDFRLILLVTPTTPPERAARIAAMATGFVYVVSVSGITGQRDRLPDELAGQLTRLRSLTDKPLCVGFGVSTPEHVRQVKDYADGVIVGSALVKVLASESSIDAVVKKASELAAALRP